MTERFEKYTPKSRVGRTIAGFTLVILGIIGIILPVIGFWLVPLGLALLAFEYAWARTFLRKTRDGLTYARRRSAARRRL